MKLVNKSEERAKEILQHCINSVLNEREYIEAIILVGSLSNGSYIEGQGRDIDQITILNNKANDLIKRNVIKHIHESEEKFNRDIPISKVVYKSSEVQRPFKRDFKLCLENKHLIEVATELQRIHESGIVLYGKENSISKLPIPTRNEVIFFDNLGREWGKRERKKHPFLEEPLKNPSIRMAVQIVLTTAMKHYYYATGKTCSNKHKIAERMKESIVDYKFQGILDLASQIKINPNKETSDLEEKRLKNGCLRLIEWKEKKDVYEVPLL